MLLACSGGDSGPTPTPLVRTFDEDDCPFEVENEDVECGWLTVPADRDDPDSEEIELNVAVFEARSRRQNLTPSSTWKEVRAGASWSRSRLRSRT